MQTIKEVVLRSMSNKIIRYALIKNVMDNSKVIYGICVSEKTGNGAWMEEKIENISDNKDFVLELINYLSENVIDTAHFKDIVEDYSISPR